MMKEETADEALGRLIAEARLRQLRQQQPQPIQDASVPEWSDYVPVADYSILHSLERKAHLDTFMAVVNDYNNAEYKDAYQERWNEVYPGHPLFAMEDHDRLQRWLWKATRGLPRVPSMTSSPAPPSYGPLSAPTQETCHRKNTTTCQGSNGYVKILKCKDCHKILEQEKVKDGKMDVDDVKSGKKHGECDHAEKDWRGSTGTTWQWKCKDCGHFEKGDRAGKAKGKGSDPSASSSSATSGEADVAIELTAEGDWRRTHGGAAGQGL